VAAILRRVLGLEKGSFKAAHHHPEHFLIVFSSLEDKRRALAQRPESSARTKIQFGSEPLVPPTKCRHQNRLFLMVELETQATLNLWKATSMRTLPNSDLPQLPTF
jgi:hypothetical protein